MNLLELDEDEEPTNTRVFAVLLGVLCFLLLLWTNRSLGYAVDEATYLWVAREERAWCGELLSRPVTTSFSKEKLADGFHFLEAPYSRPNQPHSNMNLPLAMHLLNVSWLLTHWFTSELLSCRLANMLLFSGALAWLCWELEDRQRGSGLLTGFLLVCSPRLFGHAHLAATETPLTVFWLLALVTIAKEPDYDDDGKAKRPVVGWYCLLWTSLAMAVKLSGWFIWPAFAIWLVLDRPRGWFRVLLIGPILGILTVVALTPTLWHQPIASLREYFSLVAKNPWAIPSFYRGIPYLGTLPWYSGIDILFHTIPISHWILAAVAICLSGRKNRLVVLTLINLLVVLIARGIGLFPTHDVDRQMIMAYGMIALLGGQAVTQWIVAIPRSRLFFSLLVLIAVGESATELVHYREFPLCYYNRLIGGVDGAKAAGMETTYWFETVREEDWESIMSLLPNGAKIFFRPNHPGLDDMKRWGTIHADVLSTGPEEANFYLLTANRASFCVPTPGGDGLVLTRLGDDFDRAPTLFERSLDGVRLNALIPVRGSRKSLR